MKLNLALIGIFATLAAGQAFGQTKMNNTDGGVVENPDGSYTIFEPRMLRGHKSFPIYYGAASGACALFGFDKHLNAVVSYSENTYSNIVSLKSDGSYYSTTSGYILTEITCINDGEHEKVGKADEIIENPDGSVSFINPKIVHGNEVYDIYYSAAGACALFGYEEVLSGMIDYEDSDDYAISLNSNGTYYSRTSGSKLTAISCHSEKVRNVGAAGSKIYYHSSNSSLSSLHELGIETIQLH